MLINTFKSDILNGNFFNHTAVLSSTYIRYSRMHKLLTYTYTNIFTGDLDMTLYSKWVN